MATYYVGSGGNDGNSGLTWALRKLTLNGAEDVPVVAGDTVYVAPGVYRETLTCDVSGGAGTEIAYIGDVTGENTDGVGGIVRITGSDDDETSTRVQCISGDGIDYRTFRGFMLDTCTTELITAVNAEYWIIEDCDGQCEFDGFVFTGPDQLAATIRRCTFLVRDHSVEFNHSSDVSDCGHLIENCSSIGGYANGTIVYFNNVGGATIKNCTIRGGKYGVWMGAAPAGGQMVYVYNCLIIMCNVSVQGAGGGPFITVDYCALYGNALGMSNVTDGGHNEAGMPPIFMPQLRSNELRFPSPIPVELSPWSPVRAITGTSEATDDLMGITRPTTSAKKSWGPSQFRPVVRDTGTIHGGTASMELSDAGSHQIWVPHEGAEITISVYVYREANYAGTNPRMVIKQPSQADRTTTDAGAAGGWNQLTDTFTPAADPEYVVVELQSLNTAVAGNYAAYFDDLEVA